jgi:apolipoprotein D and lipocalin family protein
MLNLASWLLAALLSVIPMLFPPQASPVTTVARVDLQRYLGTWYELAKYPNWFQKSCTGDVRAEYVRRDDGRLDVINRCRTADGQTEAIGVARVVDATSSAKLKVRFAPAALSFLPFVWGDYWVLGLADDYSWAVVGSPDRKYLWILSRTPALSDDEWHAAMTAVTSNGFDELRLVRTPQTGAEPVPRTGQRP